MHLRRRRLPTRKFRGTTTTGATTTTGPRDPEDPNFCENENDGFYPHPVCAKYYHCAGGVTNIRVRIKARVHQLISQFRNAAQELSGIPSTTSATGSTTLIPPTAVTRIQRQRHHHRQQQRQRHQRQRRLQLQRRRHQ